MGTDQRTIRQRTGAELISGDQTDLKNQDLVSLDGVEIIVHGQKDLDGKWER